MLLMTTSGRALVLLTQAALLNLLQALQERFSLLELQVVLKFWMVRSQVTLQLQRQELLPQEVPSVPLVLKAPLIQ